MKNTQLVLLILAIGVSAPIAFCGTLTVAASANIFAAGAASPPVVIGGGGTLPPVFSFATGSNQILTFSSVTGSVCYCSSPNGPDGGDPALAGTMGTNIDSFGGISGLFADHVFFLVGVFLDDNTPAGVGPTRLDFRSTGITEGFSILSPVLGQTFFIGDGLTDTGSGTVQRFLVPATATRLFLGFADGAQFAGQPNRYGDNTGSLDTTFSIVATPEPQTIVLAALGLGFLILGRRGRET